MPTFKVREFWDADNIIIDADYGDGFDHSNMRVIVGQNIPPYTDAADLQAKLTAYVQMRVDEQNARKARKAAQVDAETLVGKTTMLPVSSAGPLSPIGR